MQKLNFLKTPTMATTKRINDYVPIEFYENYNINYTVKEIFKKYGQCKKLREMFSLRRKCYGPGMDYNDLEMEHYLDDYYLNGFTPHSAYFWRCIYVHPMFRVFTSEMEDTLYNRCLLIRVDQQIRSCWDVEKLCSLLSLPVKCLVMYIAHKISYVKIVMNIKRKTLSMMIEPLVDDYFKHVSTYTVGCLPIYLVNNCIEVYLRPKNYPECVLTHVMKLNQAFGRALSQDCRSVIRLSYPLPILRHYMCQVFGEYDSCSHFSILNLESRSAWASQVLALNGSMLNSELVRVAEPQLGIEVSHKFPCLDSLLKGENDIKLRHIVVELALLATNICQCTTKKHLISLLGLYLSTKSFARKSIDMFMDFVKDSKFAVPQSDGASGSLLSLFGAGFSILGFGTKPTKLNLRNLVLECGSLARAFTNIEGAMRVLPDLIKRLINWVYRLVTGSEYFEKDETLVNLTTRVTNFVSKSDQSDLDYDNEVEAKEFKELLQEVTLNIQSRRGTPVVNDYLSLLSTLRTCKPMVVPDPPDKRRPFSLYLYGNSQIGKSFMVMNVLVDLIETDSNLTIEDRIKIIENLNHYTYVRNSETVYMDGLTQYKKYIIYDDFGQRRDIPGSENSEMMEVLRLLNVMPSVGHMAAVEQKGRVCPLFDIMMMTANFKNPLQVENINEQEALFNRLKENRFEVVLVDKYKLPDKRINKDLVLKDVESGLIKNVDVWYFKEELSDGSLISYRYDEFITILRERMKVHSDQQGKRLDDLLNMKKSAVVRLAEQLNIKASLPEPQVKIDSVFAPLELYKRISLTRFLMDYNQGHNQAIYQAMFFEREDDRILLSMLKEIQNVCKTQIQYSACYPKLRPLLNETELEKVVQWYNDWRKVTAVADVERFQSWVRKHPWLTSALAVAGIGSTIAVTVGISSCFKKCFDKITAWFGSEKREIVTFSAHVFKFEDMPVMVRLPNDSECRMFPLEKIAYRVEVDEEFVDPSDLQTNTNLNAITNFRIIPRKTGTALKFMELISKPLVYESQGGDYSKMKTHMKFAVPQHKNMNELFVLAKKNMVPTQQQVTFAKLKNNQMTIHLLDKNLNRFVGGCLALRGKYVIMPFHYFFCDFETIVFKTSSGREIPISNDIKIRFINGNEWLSVEKAREIWASKLYRDVVVLDLNGQEVYPEFKSIESMFVRGESLSSRSYAKCVLPILRNQNGVIDNLQIMLGSCKPIASSVEVRDDESGFFNFIQDGIEYSAYTSKGDCGSPIVSFVDDGPGLIIGIHSAGYASLAAGYGENITYEMIQKVLVNPQPEMCKVTYTDDVLQVPCGLEFVGRLSKKEYVSRETQFEKSPLYEEDQCQSALSALKVVDGVDPLFKGIMKQSGTKRLIPDFSNNISDFFLYHAPKDLKMNGPFTQECAIRGIIGDPCFQPLNRSTGAGFGWRNVSRGKRDLILDDFTVVPELQASIDRRLEALKRCERVDMFYLDTLKDETRPKRKVLDLNTRVFSYPQVDYVILCRQYFGPFMHWFHSSKIKNNSLIGLNVHSGDSGGLYKSLKKHGNVLAGDFKGWDSDVLSQLMHQIFQHYVDPWFRHNVVGYDYQYSNILRILLLDLCYATHICEDIVYRVDRGMPSGHPLTSIFNTLYNLIMFYLSFVQLVPAEFQRPDIFFQHIECYFYGDDNILSISNFLIKKFNYQTVAKVLRDVFQHTYTLSSKEAIDNRLFDDLLDVTILQRHFIFVDGEWRLALKEQTIREIVMWKKKKISVDESVGSNLDMAMIEWSAYGKTKYNNEMDRLMTLCKQKNLSHLISRFMTYETMRSRVGGTVVY